MQDRRYIRTDRNGTKIFHNYTCTRCGGAGRSDKWCFTGYDCYDCGGTGRRTRPKVEKEYTPEYRAKLDAKEAARAQAKLEKRAAEIEQRKADGYFKVAKKYGFNENGVGYIYTGNTYEIKEQLRLNGAKFSFALHWVSPRPIFDYPCIEINAADVMDWFDGCDNYDLSNEKCEAWREAHGLKW